MANQCSNSGVISKDCIFCSIINKESKASIQFEDENFIVFDDISPASDFHVLIVPKQHIKNIKSLTKDDVLLVENMKNIASNLIQDKELDFNSSRLGFHLPPFNSINHLHLHLISPTANMSFFKRMQFKPGTWWFTELDSFLNSMRA